jgi:hypothetical protein
VRTCLKTKQKHLKKKKKEKKKRKLKKGRVGRRGDKRVTEGQI